MAVDFSSKFLFGATLASGSLFDYTTISFLISIKNKNKKVK